MIGATKLILWNIAGIVTCGLLIPIITETGGVQVYVNFAAFLAIYIGGMFSIVRKSPFGEDYVYSYSPPQEKNDGISVSTLQNESINPKIIGNIVERFVNDPKYKWQHSFLLFKNNNLVVDLMSPDTR